MSEVLIQRVRLDPTGHLRLQPAHAFAYPHIYRDASSVRWDDSTGEFFLVEAVGFDARAEFRQITGAVEREYGDELVLSPSTEYVGISGTAVAGSESLPA